MLFKIVLALAAYYVGRSGMGLDEFLELLERFVANNDGM